MVKKFLNSLNEPIVETKAGKLRGFCLDGIYTFHGIKYADAKRFQAPVPVKSWEGIKNATNYGYISPTSGSPAPSSEIFIPHRFWPADEDCQYLNVWTPGINDGRKRPVMFWMHGGGYSDGSSIEQVAYEGDQLAEYGDVVVVSINHRLNILGYLDMSSFGEKYANSVNAGIADIVVALEWVRDNITSFGGDPDNITIFGQSGGGGKVQTLLQTPAAAGLFHKAIIMSGVLPLSNEEQIDFRVLILVMLEELNLKEDEIEALETIPYYFLDRAYQRASEKLGIRVNCGPVANEWYAGLPLDTPFTEYAKKVPTMVGSTVAELSIKTGIEDNMLTDYELEKKLRKKFGNYTDEIFSSFYNTFHENKLNLLSSFDTMFRTAAVEFAEKKNTESSVPTYLYQFALKFPLMNDIYAWHCSDIPFVFHNTNRVPCCNKENITEKLEAQMAGAWVSFAYSGNPNHPGLPKWDAYGEKKATMIFDGESRCCEDFDTDLINKIHTSIGKPKHMSPAQTKNSQSSETKRDWMY